MTSPATPKQCRDTQVQWRMGEHFTHLKYAPNGTIACVCLFLLGMIHSLRKGGLSSPQIAASATCFVSVCRTELPPSCHLHLCSLASPPSPSTSLHCPTRHPCSRRLLLCLCHPRGTVRPDQLPKLQLDFTISQLKTLTCPCYVWDQIQSQSETPDFPSLLPGLTAMS